MQFLVGIFKILGWTFLGLYILVRIRQEVVKGAKDFLIFYLDKRRELITELEKKVEDYNKSIRRIDPNAN